MGSRLIACPGDEDSGWRMVEGTNIREDNESKNRVHKMIYLYA